MNRSDINKYLTDPNLVDHTTSDDLRRLIDIYPYCEALYWIYLRSLYIKDDAIFDDELMKYGLYISNRKLFYNYLTYESTTPNPTNGQDSQLAILSPEAQQPSVLITQIATPDYFTLAQNQTQKQSLQQLAEQLKKARLARKNTENKDTSINIETKETDQTIDTNDNKQQETNTSNLPTKPKHNTQKANKHTKEEKDKQTPDSNLSEENAKKLIKEQKYLEAIEILRAISLNNPKKSANFALQIKFLETIINNHNKKQ